MEVYIQCIDICIYTHRINVLCELLNRKLITHILKNTVSYILGHINHIMCDLCFTYAI